MTREDYERLCEEKGWEAVPDAELGNYGDRYMRSDRGTPEEARQNRWRSLQREADKARSAAQEAQQFRALAVEEELAPRKEGQLWEECPRCGREPVYLPLHLCEECWP